MTVQTFRDLLAERPFKPFRLVLSSGEKYEVRHPEMALLTKSDLLVGLAEEDGLPTNPVRHGACYCGDCGRVGRLKRVGVGG